MFTFGECESAYVQVHSQYVYIIIMICGLVPRPNYPLLVRKYCLGFINCSVLRFNTAKNKHSLNSYSLELGEGMLRNRWLYEISDFAFNM